MSSYLKVRQCCARVTPETTLGQVARRLRDAYRRQRTGKRAGDVHWVRYAIDPIAKVLGEVLGREVEVLGPHGIGARVSLHAFKPGVRNRDARGQEHADQFRADNCRSLTIEPGDLQRGGPFLRVDYSKDTGKYRPGTLGEINGFNHPAEPIPPETTVRQLVALLS